MMNADPPKSRLDEAHATKPARSAALAISALGVLVLVVVVLVLARDDDDDPSTATAPAAAPEGVATFDVPSRNHVDGLVDYGQTPPVGGDHAPAWWNCGAYDEPIVTESGVHSLEHGAVWITYQPDLDPREIDALRAFATEPFVLLSPWATDALPSPVVASAWGAQLELQTADDVALEDFVAAYRQAASSPEPGAPCTGGTDFMTTG